LFVASCQVVAGFETPKEAAGGGGGAPACGTKAAGEVFCEGDTLKFCDGANSTAVSIDQCSSTDVCTASLPASGIYDSGNPPTCVAGCSAGQFYCDGATLLHCRDDGTGPVDAGQVCASAALCDQGITSGNCPAGACAVNERRCSGGETQLIGQECRADQSGWDTVAICSTSSQQCNPSTGGCFDLKVDGTEVTRADYAAYLMGSPAIAGQPKACSWNTDFKPDSSCTSNSAYCSTGCDNQPQTCIDWCDARAYCAAQGRHLCGRVGGGPNPFDRHDDAGASEWFNACTAGGQPMFVYQTGASPTGQWCNYQGLQNNGPTDVGARADCHGAAPGYTQVFDLTGNVAEWEDSCNHPEDTGDGTDVCHTRGGHYLSPLNDVACAALPSVPFTRNQTSPKVGFRCCG